jgi:hypothetical protein
MNSFSGGHVGGGFLTFIAWTISIVSIAPFLQITAALCGTIIGIYTIAQIIKKEYKLWITRRKK